MTLDESEIARRRKIVDSDIDYTSSKISEAARYIGFGLAGLTFIFLTSGSSFAAGMITNFRIPIVVVSAIGCMIILCDYLHYYFGYKASQEARSNIDKNIDLYNVRSFYFRGRHVLFAAKHYLAVIGSFFFIIILLVALFSASSAGYEQRQPDTVKHTNQAHPRVSPAQPAYPDSFLVVELATAV